MEHLEEKLLAFNEAIRDFQSLKGIENPLQFPALVFQQEEFFQTIQFFVAEHLDMISTQTKIKRKAFAVRRKK